MMRKFFLLMTLSIAISTINAQWSLKPEAGVMLVNSTNNKEWNNRFTGGLGAEYEWQAGDLAWGLQSGLYYTQRGFENNGYSTATNSTAYFYNKLNRSFIQLPVKLNLYIPLTNCSRLVVGAGPYVAYDVHTSWGYGSNEYSAYKNGYGSNSGTKSGPFRERPSIRKWDYGVGANVALEVKNFFLGVGYDMSFGKEVKAQKSGIQYHNLTFTAGYRFKMGK